MFLSNAQMGMVERLYDEGTVDIMQLNISTVCALITRGVVHVYYNRETTVGLTAIGENVARKLDYFRALPKYRELLDRTRVAKYGAKTK